MANSTDVDPNLREQLVEPCNAAFCEAIRDMAGVEAVPAGCIHTKTARPPHTISVLLRLQSTGPEYLLLSTPESTARELARRMLPGAVKLDDVLIPDCVGEIANITAGQAKALLHGTPFHFSFSTPIALSGTEKDLPPAAAECLEMDFQSEIGPFTLQIGLKPGSLSA